MSIHDYDRFKADQEPEPVERFVPYGVCSRHLYTFSNGMFDSVCPMCEAANDEFNVELKERTQ